MCKNVNVYIALLFEQIVWDPVTKKWLNKDEDGDSSSAMVGPPPKASDMGFRAPMAEQPIHSSHPPSQADESNVNKFKLPKGRSMRANYIDVMNPSGLKSGAAPSSVPTPATSPMVPMATSSPQLFIPAPGTFSITDDIVLFLILTYSSNSSSNPRMIFRSQ